VTDSQTSNAPAKGAETPIGSIQAAEELCDRIGAIMDALIETLEREIKLVRAGRVLAAGEIQPSKSELSRRYLKEMNVAHHNTGPLERFVPDRVKNLQRKHCEFRSLLQINLAVLATAQQVSLDDAAATPRRASGSQPEDS
jgi:hypothetical protein